MHIRDSLLALLDHGPVHKAQIHQRIQELLLQVVDLVQRLVRQEVLRAATQKRSLRVLMISFEP